MRAADGSTVTWRWSPAWVAALLVVACEADPGLVLPADRPPEETGFVGGSPLRVERDDLRPSGWFLDVDDFVLQSVGPVLRHGVRTWPVTLEWRGTTGGHRSFAFFLDPGTLSIPLEPGRDNRLELVLLPGPEGGPERVVARTEVGMDPEARVIPVVTWNVGGGIPDLGAAQARYLFDRADDLHAPAWVGPTSWARQRVDAVWAPCGLQFRLVAHHDEGPAGECWRAPVVSNQSDLFQRCTTTRPQCWAGYPEVQDFTDCAAQHENGCSLLELVRVAAEDPGYAGPPVFQDGAINVYFFERFDLYENLTLAIGCTGQYPLIAMSAQWPDSPGLRLAHELGHVMGITDHTSGTIMGGETDRTDQVTGELCQQARAYVRDHYGFVP